MTILISPSVESCIGKPLERVDGLLKAEGKAAYTDDLVFPGMLYGKGFYSSSPHGLIRSVDVREAQRQPGVISVLTAGDIPGKNEIGVVKEGQPLLAYEKVRYAGDCIALVAAESREAAEKASRLIKVDYEALPGVFHPEDALKAGVPAIHPGGNKALHLKLRKGNTEEGFREADVVLKRRYEVKHQEHVYLETQGAVAVPGPDGEVTLYGSIQCPFYVQKAVARCLGIGYNKVRVIQVVMGGGFGGKEDVPSEVCARAALLAVASGRPVKMVLTREEDLVTTSKRHPMIMDYKIGAKKDGRLTAIEVTIYADCGAYDSLSPVVLFRTNVHAAGPYVVPHVRVDTIGVYTNQFPTGAMRGFGQPQVAFASESLMDELASELSMDPMELRLKNALREGSLTATSHKLTESVGLVETLEEAREASGWDKKREEFSRQSGGVRRGIGVATSFYGVSLGSKGWALDKAGAHLQVWQDGTINVAVGNVDMGQGALTVLTQIAAEALGVTTDRVRMLETSTGFVPDSGPSVASRTTLLAGNAVIAAAREIREKLVAVAASLLGASPEEVNGFPNGYSARGREISFEKVTRECYLRNVCLSTMGYFTAPPLAWDEEVSQGEAYFIYSYATHIAEVEVDLLSGAVQVLKLTAAHDVGRAINPQSLEGQIEGGALQGIGYALYENMVMKEGRLLSSSLATYTIPTVLDAPEFKVILIEKPYSGGPFGAKGFAETPLIPSAPAVANAIFNAVGYRARRLPILPEDIAEVDAR
ncbi:MAG: xanthine dehydrogenase family protein molybdopterin-binding subunit [bacterium]